MATTKKKGGKDAKKPDVPAYVALDREARESGESDDPRRTDRIAGRYPAEAARRLLLPERAQAEAVLEALEGLAPGDAAEAWETLAARGLIPVQWTSNGARQITVDGAPCRRCAARVEFIGHAPGCERADVPATVHAAATLASDPAGVAGAEALAKTAFERLYGDSSASQPRIVWRVGVPSRCNPLTPRRPGKAQAKAMKPGLWDAARRFVDALKVRRDHVLPAGWVQSDDGTAVRADNGWAFPARQPGFVIANREWVTAFQADAVHAWSWALSVREKRPNPFAPLCDVWMLGYAVDTIDDETIVLFAPALPDR